MPRRRASATRTRLWQRTDDGKESIRKGNTLSVRWNCPLPRAELAHGGLVMSVPSHPTRRPPQFASDGRYRALFNGARAGEVDVVRTLLSEGLLVNCAGPRGATPLHIAARFGQPQMVSLLIAQKADPMAKWPQETPRKFQETPT